MSKKTAILSALGVAVILIISYCQFWNGGVIEPSPDQTDSSVPTSIQERPQPSAPVNKAMPPPPDTSAVEPSNGFLPTEMEDPGKFEAYQKSLKDMAVCLNMEMNPLDAEAEINFDVLNQAINPDLGEIVTQTEEWTTTDLRTKGGELRRIYIENLPDLEMKTSRSLKYYLYGVDGVQKEIPLAKEQMANPSDALIASLESDGEVVGRSVSRRIFYQNGDDLLLVEKNGKIFSFEMVHDGKTYRCTGADKASTFKCQCK